MAPRGGTKLWMLAQAHAAALFQRRGRRGSQSAPRTPRTFQENRLCGPGASPRSLHLIRWGRPRSSAEHAPVGREDAAVGVEEGLDRAPRRREQPLGSSAEERAGDGGGAFG